MWSIEEDWRRVLGREFGGVFADSNKDEAMPRTFAWYHTLCASGAPSAEQAQQAQQAVSRRLEDSFERQEQVATMRDQIEAYIVAYQTASLERLRQAFDVLDVDVAAYLSREQQMADKIAVLARKLRQLTATGAVPAEALELPIAPETPRQPAREVYPRLDLLPMESVGTLAQAAQSALEQSGIDPKRDPLLQVLNTQQIGSITAAYRRKYGDVAWNQADYAVVTVAGVLGAVVELLVVKLPGRSELLLTLPQGCAMTAWLTEHVNRLRPDLAETITTLRQDPEAAAAGNRLWRFITVLLDLARCSGTAVDAHGNIVTARRLTPEQERTYTIALLRAVSQAVREVLATIEDDDAPADIGQLPLEAAVSWEAVAAYAEAHGYRPLTALRQGLIPAALELFVHGYWLLQHYAHQERIAPARLKLVSMLALAHTLAMSGYLVKSGILFHINPLALNWAQMMRCLPLLLAWINEGIERETTIRAALDNEWQRLYQRALAFDAHD